MLDCVERTDKAYVTPWAVIDTEDDNKLIATGKTPDDAWRQAADCLNETLWTLRQAVNEAVIAST